MSFILGRMNPLPAGYIESVQMDTLLIMGLTLALAVVIAMRLRQTPPTQLRVE